MKTTDGNGVEVRLALLDLKIESFQTYRQSIICSKIELKKIELSHYHKLNNRIDATGKTLPV